MKYIFSLCACVFLFGCNSEKIASENTNNLLAQVVENQRESVSEKSAELSFDILEENEDGILVAINLANPDAKDIQSVQSWVVFPSHILEGIRLENIESSPFQLEAPGEFKFDNTNGLVKISVSNIDKTPLTQKKITVAKMVFLKKQKTPFQLTFFDKGTEGKTRVYTLENGELVDILK